MNKLKTIVLLTALIILLSCGGRQNERKMEVAKVKQERLGIKPISVDKNVIKNEDTVVVITTTLYTNETFEKLEKIRKERSVKRKQK
jgi:hypothetical protein|tara:strand:- start:2231 stop:2491 length:261 start_codon:yes stop_codon:yes gene_type:complete